MLEEVVDIDVTSCQSFTPLGLLSEVRPKFARHGLRDGDSSGVSKFLLENLKSPFLSKLRLVPSIDSLTRHLSNSPFAVKFHVLGLEQNTRTLQT